MTRSYNFGDLNYPSRRSAVPKADPYTTDPLAVFRQIIGREFSPKIFSAPEGFRGICLRATLQSGDIVNTWAVSNENSSDELLAVKVMIPELHAYLCNPFGFTEAGCKGEAGIDQKIVDLYPTFLAKTKEFGNDVPAPGDIVAVDFGNRDTMSDPVYKGRVFSNPQVFTALEKANQGFGKCAYDKPVLFENTEDYSNPDQPPYSAAGAKPAGIKEISKILNRLGITDQRWHNFFYVVSHHESGGRANPNVGMGTGTTPSYVKLNYSKSEGRAAWKYGGRKHYERHGKGLGWGSHRYMYSGGWFGLLSGVGMNMLKGAPAIYAKADPQWVFDPEWSVIMAITYARKYMRHKGFKQGGGTFKILNRSWAGGGHMANLTKPGVDGRFQKGVKGHNIDSNWGKSAPPPLPAIANSVLLMANKLGKSW